MGTGGEAPLSELTIILPLKGRHLHTLRFLWHAQQIALPCPLFIADGLVHPTVANILERSAEFFPALTVKYVRYPDDDTVHRFYHKMSDISGRVTTGYSMLADNDDLVCVEGLRAGISFLKAQQDLVAYGARVIGFSLSDPEDGDFTAVQGDMNLLFPHPFLGDTKPDIRTSRDALKVCGEYPLHYYSIFKSAALHGALKEWAGFGFREVFTFEAYCLFRLFLTGPTHFAGDNCCWLRQQGTTLATGKQGELLSRLFRPHYAEELAGMIRFLAADLERRSDVTQKECSDALYDQYTQFIGRELARQYRSAAPGSSRRRSLARAIEPGMVRRWRHRRGFSVSRERQALGQLMQRNGGTQAKARFERDLRQAEASLADQGFIAFVQNNAPDLLAAPERANR